MHDSISGWRRENGRIGIRNHVAVLPANERASAICAAIAVGAPGAVALPSAAALAEGSTDAQLLHRIAVGLGSHPNVAATAVVACERGAARSLAEAIAASGKPVVEVTLDDAGDDREIGRANAAIRELLRLASGLKRETCSMSELWIAAKCDQSDATTGLAACPAVGNMYDRLVPDGIHAVFGETPELLGAAAAVAKRAADANAAAKWGVACRMRQAELAEARLRGTAHRQPTDINIAGGLTTVEAKALASLEKIGRACRYIDVLQPAEPPTRGAGLYYMDTSSEIEAIDHMAAAGFVIAILPTGTATCFGNPIVPILQINGNPAALRAMGRHIDLDVSGVLAGTLTMQQAGDALIDLIRRTANGEPAAAERPSV